MQNTMHTKNAIQFKITIYDGIYIEKIREAILGKYNNWLGITFCMYNIKYLKCILWLVYRKTTSNHQTQHQYYIFLICTLMTQLFQYIATVLHIWITGIIFSFRICGPHIDSRQLNIYFYALHLILSQIFVTVITK